MTSTGSSGSSRKREVLNSADFLLRAKEPFQIALLSTRTTFEQYEVAANTAGDMIVRLTKGKSFGKSSPFGQILSNIHNLKQKNARGICETILEIIEELEDDPLFELFYAKFQDKYEISAGMSRSLRQMFDGGALLLESSPANTTVWKPPKTSGLKNSEPIVKGRGKPQSVQDEDSETSSEGSFDASAGGRL